MSTSSGWVRVDDADPLIQYSSGWQVVVNGSEFDGTKHGAAAAGLTASFNFTGTQVAVVGSLGSVDVHGIPTTLYTLDGAVAGVYTAPILQPGTFALNVTFFTSQSVSAGEHMLTIANVNGTSPNVFWLDYIEYIPSALATTSLPATVVTSQSATTTVPASSQTHQSSSSNPSTSNTNVGAIVGGVVGGIALVLAAVLLLICLRRRRKRGAPRPDGEIRPFETWKNRDEVNSASRPALPRQMEMGAEGASTFTLPTTTNAPLSAAFTSSNLPTSTLSSASGSMAPVSTGTERLPATKFVSSSSSPAIEGRPESGSVAVSVPQAVDSGLRLAEGATVLLPPPYTRD